ncbi:hypothetical protein NPIL_665311 [Nephila pilipes]|uniref:Uncharacterized protein n=1 Tax=Nephila pilipes TaxID=299642 RepID=A0A8X6MN89_NEPPI|nr:hypothetical protein NPIL_665311 [Nephila pilipes]
MTQPLNLFDLCIACYRRFWRGFNPSPFINLSLMLTIQKAAPIECKLTWRAILDKHTSEYPELMKEKEGIQGWGHKVNLIMQDGIFMLEQTIMGFSLQMFRTLGA